MIVADSVAWTGRRAWADQARDMLIAHMVKRGVGVLDRRGMEPVYAAVDYLAARAGIAPVTLFYDPRAMPWVGAEALPLLHGIALSPKAFAMPPRRLAALLAHEVGHLAAGHGASPHYLATTLRPVSLAAVVAALALGDLALILAAVVAWIAVYLGVLRFTARMEEEADAIAARIVGSVLPLIECERAWRATRTRMDLANVWALAYPIRRPWLERMAADELAELHRAHG